MQRSVAFVMALALAGCVAEDPSDESPLADLPPGIAYTAKGLDGPVVVRHDPVVDLVTALEIVPAGEDCAVGCLLEFQVVVPGDIGVAWVEARIAWDGTQVAGHEVALQGPAAARGMQRGFDAARDQIWDPVSGGYTLTVQGAGEFEGWIRLFDHDGQKLAGDDLLPNLVTLAPNEIGIDACLPEETAEQQAVRCLRLGNSVANLGDGPLEVHLDFPNGALSLGGMGRFVQRVYQDDGFRDLAAGPAQFHATHSHFHYAGLAEFLLFEHDETTGLRGAEVGRHMKQGFCFLDWGAMNDPETDPEAGRHAEQACLLPNLGAGWSMGISVGWYDFYWAALADQYVEISGVPDGVYELVSVADGGQTLAETDETDNSASAIIHIESDLVNVLEKRAFYANPEG